MGPTMGYEASGSITARFCATLFDTIGGKDVGARIEFMKGNIYWPALSGDSGKRHQLYLIESKCLSVIWFRDIVISTIAYSIIKLKTPFHYGHHHRRLLSLRE